MLKKQFIKRKSLIMAVILTIAMLSTSCSARKEDDNPPSAPLLTITEVSKDSVALAWSESYDNEGIDTYKLYRDGEVIKSLSKTEYKDTDVKEGEEHEYYVVAYDESGNRSSKSVKQHVKVADNGSAKGDEPEAKKIDLQKLSRSTIKLYKLDNDLNIVAMGSGTIINKEGYILTNFHCVGEQDGSLTNKDGYVAIALTDDIKKNIQPQYIAQFRSGVQALDIAVVKIVSDLNWNEVTGDDLNLVPAKLGDSNEIKMGDDINILGYPGVGGETITYTAGRVSGFIDENSDDEVDWIKTDAVVNHGNSGGTAIDQKGYMIGIPSAKQTGEDNDIMFYLKPINQALPIIEDAMAQGDNPELPSQNQPDPKQEQPEATETISITGRILDSLTLEPIVGAGFVVLKDGVTTQQFADDPTDDKILSYGETDKDGAFVCPNIPKGGTYSVIIGADGYNPYLEDSALDIGMDFAYEELDVGDINLEKAQ